jgi:hypothetical protein
MGQYDYKPVASLATFKSELIAIFQLLFVLALVGGWAWAVINIHHPEGYYEETQ